MKEFTSENSVCLAVQELGPGGPQASWGRIDPGAVEDRPDCRGADLAPHAGMFSGDAPVAPARVLGRHARISLRSDSEVGGRPRRWRLPVQRRLIKLVCHRESVLGVTNRSRRQALGSSRTQRADESTVRPARPGRTTCQRKTLTW